MSVAVEVWGNCSLAFPRISRTPISIKYFHTTLESFSLVIPVIGFRYSASMRVFWSVMTFLLTICTVNLASGQQLNLSRLFYPNATIRAEYYPGAGIGQGADYGLTRTSVLGLVPIQSEVQASFSLRKKFDLRAVHTLMYAHYGQTSPAFNEIQTPQNGFKSVSLGVIRLQASLKDKLWVYGGGLGISESNETFFTPKPHLWGGAARMHILGLQTQIAYGTMLVYNQKLMVVPVFGVNKRFNKNWRATAILPFSATVRYNAEKWLSMEMIAGLNGYSSGFKVAAPATPELERLNRQNYRHVKVGLAVNAHLLSVFNVSLEGGVTTFRSLKEISETGQALANYQPAAVPYVGVSLRYITSRSKLSSKFTRRMGIGESGLNW